MSQLYASSAAIPGIQIWRRVGDRRGSLARVGRISTGNPSIDQRLDRRERRIWEFVSRSPLESLWDLKGVPLGVVIKRTWQSIVEDRLFGHAAELGFYFLFALFPTLLCASSILGLAARSAYQIYERLLDYLALVIPDGGARHGS